MVPITTETRGSTAGLTVRDLYAGHRRRDQPVVKGVDLDLARGEIVGVLGPNGCGKSSLLKSLCGVLAPRSGSVTAEGLNLLRIKPARRAKILGYIPQHEDMAVDGLTLAESMSLALDRRALGQRAVTDIVLDTAARLGLTGMALRRVAELSGGQRQRALIGRALAARTPYLLLDEPVSSLDLRYQLEILDILVDLARTGGVGVLIVLHDLNLAVAYCDRLVVLNQGRVHSKGAAPELVTTALVEDLYGPVAEVVDLGDARYVLPPQRKDR